MAKICPRCNEREKAGEQGYCKQCRREYSKEWYRKAVEGTTVVWFDWKGFGLGNIYGAMKHTNARSRGLEWEISKEFFLESSQKPCYYCGRLKVNKNKYGLPYNGLDRLDNSIGYTESNVVVCCGTCNLMRGSQAVDEFIDSVKRIHAHLNL